MSLIHSQLYQNERFDRIDMDGHIRELSHHLQSVYGSGKKIDLILTPSKVYFSVSQAIPCALVLNELISNVFKHAFREKKQGMGGSGTAFKTASPFPGGTRQRLSLKFPTEWIRRPLR